MTDVSDMELLRDYDRQGSEDAFAELVRRHINLVYSAAFRHAGIAAHAEEITQAVFVILSRKAASLRPDTILDAWLYETTRLTSLSFLRRERRRQFREQEAYMQSTIQESSDKAVWNQLAPLLDEAMARLGKKDREALVLRFFKDKSLNEVALALKTTEAAAQSRVHRAVQKLQKLLLKRGIDSATAAITGAISANSVQAAPAMLAKAATATAVAKGATASTSTLTVIKGALKLMAWSKAKTTIVTGAAALLAIGGGAVIYETQQNLQKEAVSVTTDGPADMRIEWTVGKKYELHMELNQTAETKSPDQSQPVEQGFRWTQDFNISALKELPNGGRQLELEFVNEAIDESQAGLRVLSFDSAKSPAGNKHNRLAILSALVGARLEYFTDADGKVQTVEGMNKLMDHVAAIGTPQQQQVVDGMFSGDTLKNYLSVGDMMPNRTVSIGDTWSVKKDVADAIGILTVNMKLTFKNWEQHGDHKCARIEEMGGISSKSVSTASGAMVKIEKGKISGDIWFDPELAMAVGGNENEDLILKITTLTKTMTKQTHNKSQWALVDAQ